MSEDEYCDVCQCSLPAGGWDIHAAGRSHCRKSGLRTEAALQSAQRDRNGVSVPTQDAELDFGVVDPSDAPKVRKSFTLKVTSETAEFMVLDPQWVSSALRETAFSCGIEGDPHLTRGRTVRIIVALRVSGIGKYEDTVEIRFARVSTRQQFSVTRSVKAIIGDAGYTSLLPAIPYVPRRRAERREVSFYVFGHPPPPSLAIAWRTKLARYRVPKHLQETLSLPPNRPESGEDIVPKEIRALFPTPLRQKNHLSVFSMLLWLEELATDDSLRVFDMESVWMSKQGAFYHLEVPGLAEKRPSVINGDTVLARISGSGDDEWFEGYVHFIHETEVGLRFHSSFPKEAEDQELDVRFQVNRSTLRRQHQALCAEHHAAHLLFPPTLPLPPTDTAIDTVASSTLSDLPATLNDPKIANNPRQLRAIEQILSLPSESTSVPYIIFGPPGTGKTVTIVEAIKQILHRNRSARVLACAPSNSAADVIARRLSELFTNQELFRFYAPSRERGTVPPDLLPFSFINPDGLFSHPPLNIVKTYRVIVCTCLSAAFTLGIGVERGHFSHVFIDEAAQATEPEAMVVVKNTAIASTKLILSGDPKQLRPIILSAIASELGLGVSYLERMMECEAYQGLYDGSTGIVKLLNNYRSHPTIIQFPSEQFYDGELEPRGDRKSTGSCLNLELLGKSKYPVIFSAVEGNDMREASSPSFFNPEEVLQVKAYVHQLLADRRAVPRIEPAQIGIIAPYRAQCTKLRQALGRIAPEIKIGSVEEYQGDERRVIIITTVRSSRDYINYDLRYTLGFVANPRRFNVAVTRAKALLIIVGDPLVLGLDPLWREYLNTVHAGGGWRGQQIPWDPSEPVNPDGGYDVDLRMRALETSDALAERLLDGDEFDAGPGEDQLFHQTEE